MSRSAHILTALLFGVSACHSAPPKDRPLVTAERSAAAELPAPAAENDASTPPAEAPKAQTAEVPSCSCVGNTPKSLPKRKPKAVTHAPPPAPLVVARAPTPAEASVKLAESSTASILGKKVRGAEGEDLGRVVDILADRQGRVRIAVIDFGGFLGVGNRRIAVDWSLLKFQPDEADAPVMLSVGKQALQDTPEYKGSARPQALMAPAEPGALPPNLPK